MSALVDRIAAALRRRLRGPYLQLGRVEDRVVALQTELSRQAEHSESMQAAVTELTLAAANGAQFSRQAVELLQGEVRGALRALVAEEAENRRRLHRLRALPEYEHAWTDESPLVTVTLVTRNRAKLLRDRSLPSVLAQTYGQLEVVVVGDAADDATEAVIQALDDPRVRYVNLTQRHVWHADPLRHWLVASTHARNEAMRLARGSWVMAHDDDDALAPDAIERLLDKARANRLEAVYARGHLHWDDSSEIVGEFPPVCGQFTWAAGLYHGGLRFFEREGFATHLGLPGDWFLADRMLRAGVRFGMLDAVLCDIYPSRDHHRLRREGGIGPWNDRP